MQNSKLTFVLGLMFLLSLSACHLPTPAQSESNAASFSVDLSQSSFTASATTDNFGFPTSKTMSVEFCARDIQYNRIITNHKFLISGGNSDQSVTTNASGCATWKEDIAYNHLATPAFVEIQRSIVAQGYQVGAVKVSFAINPWQDKVVSLKDSGVPNLVPKEQAQERLTGGQTKRPLWLQNVSVVFSPKQLSSGGTDYSVEMAADPKVILKDLYNQDSIVALTQGQFSVKMTLIREQTIGVNSARTLVSQSPDIAVDSLFSTQLIASSTLRAPGGCSLAQYYLGVEITPVKAPQGLQSFHGVYQLGPCSSIANRLMPKLLTDGQFKNNGSQDFSVAEFIQQKPQEISHDILSTDSKDESGVQQSSIQIGAIEAKSYTFAKQDSYLKERRFYLNFCLTNAADRSAIPAQSLKVTGLSGQTLSAQTFVDGCVSVEDSFSFNYYSPECWKKQEIRIQSQDLGLDERVPVEINVLTEVGPFFRDLRFPVRLQDQTNAQCASGQTQILARSFGLDKIEYDYNVDEYLNLQILKTGYLSLPLTLNRPSLSTATGVDDLHLPNGTYTLRWAVVDTAVTDYSKAAGLIYAAGEKDVEIKSNSMIVDRFTLAMSNIKAIGNTNYILFEVVPKGDEPKNMLSNMVVSTFKAPINLSNNMDGAAVETTQLNSVVPLLIHQFKADQEQSLTLSKSLSSKERFASDSHLQLLNLRTGAELGSGISNSQLRQWVSTGSLDLPTLRGLCNYWVNTILPENLKSGKESPFKSLVKDMDSQRMLVADCVATARKDPRQYFDVEYRYIIQRGSKIANLGAYTRDLTVNQAFNFSNTYTFNDSTAVSGDVSAGARTEGLGPFSASAGFRYSFLNLSWTKGKSWGNTINVMTGTPATVETIGLTVRAEDYEKCAVIKLNGNKIFQKTDNAFKNSAVGNFFHRYFQEKLLQGATANLSEDEKLEIASHGYMICMGENAGKPLAFNENYYVINQKLSVSQAMDNSTNSNRPIFVALRGRADFVTLLSFIENSIGVPDSFTKDYQESHLLYDPLVSLFHRGFRSYPGQIVSPN